MIGRWALHVAIAIVGRLGCIVIYGDTDSLMFSIPDAKANEGRLLPVYVQSLATKHGLTRAESLEYVSGARGFPDVEMSADGWLNSCIPNIVNKIMSFTALGTLAIESQAT